MPHFVPRNLHYSVKPQEKLPSRHERVRDILCIRIPSEEQLIRMQVTQINHGYLVSGRGTGSRYRGHSMLLNMRSGTFHVDRTMGLLHVTSVLIEAP